VDSHSAVPGVVLENAVVRTLDPSDKVGAALAFAAGRIVLVGNVEDARDAAPPGSRRVDLGGLTIVPGIIDAHTHFQKAALARSHSIDFLELRPTTVADVIGFVQERVTRERSGVWVRGDSLNPRDLHERRYPTRSELDSVSPVNPVVLFGPGNHSIAANSLALAIAGIDRSTEDPPGGRVERGDDGNPTGVLRELGKLRLDPNRPDSVVPSPSFEDRVSAIESGFQHLHRFGITAIHDVVMDQAEIGAYVKLRMEGRLSVRVRLLVRGYESRFKLDDIVASGLQPPFGDPWLQFSGVKLSIDGALGEHNAATYEPYPGEPRNRGLVRISQGPLDEIVERCHSSRLRLAIHAIGPRALDMALDAFERAFAKVGRGDLRHRIEHAFIFDGDRQVERLAAAGLLVSTQPAFLYDGAELPERWLEDASTRVMPLRTLLDRAVRVAGGTDYPYVPVDPWPGMSALTTRRTKSGVKIAASEAIGASEAIRLQTTEAAWAGYDEHLLGSIEAGKAADLVVLSNDPLGEGLAGEPIESVMTIAGGRIVHNPRHESAL
jgi:predicted amidohydrolase YtcJ